MKNNFPSLQEYNAVQLRNNELESENRRLKAIPSNNKELSDALDRANRKIDKMEKNKIFIPDVKDKKKSIHPANASIRQEKDLQKIIGFITADFGIPYERIISGTRKKEIVFARAVLDYFFYYSSLLSSPEIATMTGQDHSTVLGHLRKVEKLIKFSEPRVCAILLKWNELANNQA